MMMIVEDRNVAMSPDLESALAALYRNFSALLSAARWADHELGMRQFSSDIKAKVYLKTIVKKL